MSDRIVSETPLVIRHVRRTRAGETGKLVLAVSFTAAAGAELDALNDHRNGWQSGEAALKLSDEGIVTLTFPNIEGADGVLHRDRFALLTDPLYRDGEEWIEVYREPMNPANLLTVFTPQDWALNLGQLAIKGPEFPALFALARASEVDSWHHSPRDVFDWYTRLPVPARAHSYAGDVAVEADSTRPFTNNGTLSFVPAGIRLTTTNVQALSYAVPLAGLQTDNWIVEAGITWENDGGVATGVVELRLDFDGATAQTILLRRLRGGQTRLGGIVGSLDYRAAGKSSAAIPGPTSLRIIARGEWVYAFCMGELVGRGRRDPTDGGGNYLGPAGWQTPIKATITVSGGAVATLESLYAESLRPFGLRGATKGDLRTPGAPVPGGLRGRYWSESDPYGYWNPSTAGGGFDGYRASTLDETLEPSDSRLDATINFAAGTSWQPPAAQPASNAFSARWTGSIYLDLSGNGRRLRIGSLGNPAVGVGVGDTHAYARIFVGRTRLPDAPIIDRWTPATTGGFSMSGTDFRSGNLRDVLGQGSGWYPIVVEFATAGGDVNKATGITLEESALDGSGNPAGGWTPVPSSKLSPAGVLEDDLRGESHREVLKAIADGFGYQWRPEPRTLESGEFPGQAIPRIRQGRDSDRIVTAPDAVELESQGTAGDAIDRLQVDAAGIADPQGAEQLSGEVRNYVALNAGHLFASTGYESLAEISERDFLVQRASSLLALRGAPNEEVGIRPTDAGDGELTDTFPLTGSLARMRWEPGDGVRLSLADLSVIDRTPRQLLAVTWPLYRLGTGQPAIGVRQRPRGLRPFLERSLRVALTPQRTYQGQSALAPATIGSVPNGAGQPGSDGYSRAPAPRSADDVVSIELVVYSMTAGGTAAAELNGTAVGPTTIREPGRYPLDSTGIAISATSPMYVARLTGVAAYVCALEVRVRI